MKADGVEPDLRSFEKAWRASSICGKSDASSRDAALRLLEELRDSNVRPDRDIYASFVKFSLPLQKHRKSSAKKHRGVAKGDDADDSSEQPPSPPPPSPPFANAWSIGICWGLLRDLLADGQTPTPRTVFHLASAMAEAGHTKDANRLLEELRSYGVAPEPYAYSVVLRATMDHIRDAEFNLRYLEKKMEPTEENIKNVKHGSYEIIFRRDDCLRLLDAMLLAGLSPPLDLTVKLGIALKRHPKNELELDRLLEHVAARALTLKKWEPRSSESSGSGSSSSDSSGSGSSEVADDGDEEEDDDESDEESGEPPSSKREDTTRGEKCSFVRYKEILICLHEHAEFEKVRTVHSNIRKAGFQPTQLTYSMQINALEKLGMVDETVAMLEEMEAVGNVTPDAFHLSSAITACGKARRPQQALDLFESMQTEPLNIKPSRLAYATAIQACANSGWWREAVSLFMKHESDPPKCEDVKNSGKIIEDGPLVGQRIIFNAILDAIAPSTSSHILPVEPSSSDDDGGRAVASSSSVSPQPPTDPQHEFEQKRALAHLIWSRALEVGCYPNLVTWIKGGRSARLDLHNCSVGAAEMAIRWWLQDLRAPLLEAHNENRWLPSLCVITGRGKSRPDYQQRDLRESMEGLLLELGVPTITTMHDDMQWEDKAKIKRRHEGAFYLDAETIVWMARLEAAEQEDR